MNRQPQAAQEPGDQPQQAPAAADGFGAAGGAIAPGQAAAPQRQQQQQQPGAGAAAEGLPAKGGRGKQQGRAQQQQKQPGPGSPAAKPGTYSHNGRQLRPRLARMEGLEELDEALGDCGDDEEALAERLMTQLQGLTVRQQQLYGIWDSADPDAGRRAFVARWRQRHADRRALVAGVTDGATPPQERMGLRTSYILKWRKILFSCPTCWLLPGLCVCSRMARFAPAKTQVVVCAHHGEWGSASNSGCVLPTSLEGAEMLLYGHPDHDRRLQELVNDPTRVTALLWPGADALLPSELCAEAEARGLGGRLTVVALDATWGNARRMHGSFPPGTLTVRLPPESTLKENKLSLLRPVRRYRGDLESGRVSTVEAVASLLYELEGDEAMYRGLLDNLKVKVDACRIQKNRSTVYGTEGMAGGKAAGRPLGSPPPAGVATAEA